MFMAGHGIADVGRRGEPLHDDDFLLLFNAHHEDVEFTLPTGDGPAWRVRVDTASGVLPPDEAPPITESTLHVHCRTLVLLSRETKAS
jgi:isoamylase